MLKLTRFFALLSFRGSPTISLNNEPRQPRPTLIDLNSNEIHYYMFIVSLEK